ncbi:phosphopantothenoylcysteine decarboxylase subunit VHS3-like [Prosopis cineraria]|uniref:phosphopantothenoylcysteine decarboxylase subunit VHS3-like n=1 Tax=Prosopis cineraria TaxID=364024 RepID=UPI00241078A6|nr:phosphopantothenoylcysteine decarboxylase subunit VHS3-like [Prosopis cineraria]
MASLDGRGKELASCSTATVSLTWKKLSIDGKDMHTILVEPYGGKAVSLDDDSEASKALKKNYLGKLFTELKSVIISGKIFYMHYFSLGLTPSVDGGTPVMHLWNQHMVQKQVKLEKESIHGILYGGQTNEVSEGVRKIYEYFLQYANTFASKVLKLQQSLGQLQISNSKAIVRVDEPSEEEVEEAKCGDEDEANDDDEDGDKGEDEADTYDNGDGDEDEDDSRHKATAGARSKEDEDEGSDSKEKSDERQDGKKRRRTDKILMI